MHVSLLVSTKNAGQRRFPMSLNPLLASALCGGQSKVNRGRHGHKLREDKKAYLVFPQATLPHLITSSSRAPSCGSILAFT